MADLLNEDRDDRALPPGPRGGQSTAGADDITAAARRAAGTPPSQAEPQVTVHPKSIGRYAVERLLGEGGFGRVYLARDAELDRLVAIKIPKPELLSTPQDAEVYLCEARTVAQLDHPNIVPVHHSGSTPEFPIYVVAKYVEGSDLATRQEAGRVPIAVAAEIVATVAEALQHAHQQGLVHRDIKPGNILLDVQARPFVADFGLALREQDLGKGPLYAGTPAYMSPEQARGEGHRVDGRSDIFSLCVVFYELLTGRRPFAGETPQETFDQIARCEPRPPRQFDARIAKELERICLKGLSKRATDRYTTAQDLADDLRCYLSQSSVAATEVNTVGGVPVDEMRTQAHLPAASLGSDNRPIRIIPKGLRSFDQHDADFFLELLPGPRDRDGLPDSIRFWKIRIEETDPDKTFPVGLIYGPSGCGKSSLVKAGLLPRLPEEMIPVFVESTRDDTETRLLNGLRKRCPALPKDLTLTETLNALRRGKGMARGKRALIVLDQFEQWLHANQEQEDTELVQALRQCDGNRVQCLVMVRDDFWLAVSRFLRFLEIRLIEGQNSALVDLFDLDHARRVLGAFGRAFGKLPEDPADRSEQQQAFLDLAVDGLSEENKVTCVRLALFAEMMKGRSWTPASLAEVGGTTGVGLTFLEETFAASSAPAEHRYHRTAACAVLASLLPDAGTDIKGHMRSRDELLEAAGYQSRGVDIEDLFRILDDELRLITPTDPEGVDATERAAAATQPNQQYYQLTHDYLVPSLRQWLTGKQRETRRGRAELQLGERSALWNAKPENRYLPSLWEYPSIRLLTNQRNWSEAQRRMMRRAGWFYGTRALIGCVCVLMLLTAGLNLRRRIADDRERTRAEEIANSLLSADAATAGAISREVATYRRWTEPFLRSVIVDSPRTTEGRRRQLHARLALVNHDQSQVQPLLNALLTTPDWEYVRVICEALRPYRQRLSRQMWTTLRDPSQDRQQRFRAALALAQYEPDAEQWAGDDHRFAVEQLVATNPAYQPQLWQLLQGVGDRLLAPLEDVFADHARQESHQIAAANALVKFAPQDGSRMARLLTIATAGQYDVLYPAFAALPSTPLDGLRVVASQQPVDGLEVGDRIALGKRRAGAAITLLRQGDRNFVEKLLQYREDPEAVSQFVHRCRTRGVTASQLVACLNDVRQFRRQADPRRRHSEAGRQHALLLALGDYSLAELPETDGPLWVERLLDDYANDPSSAVHSATGWLLRQWGYQAEVSRIDQRELPYDPSGNRDWFVLGVDLNTQRQPREPEEHPAAAADRIHITFIVFPAGEFTMGSPESQPNRFTNERLHSVRLTRPIAVSDREITWGQFGPFDSGSHHQSWEGRLSRALSDQEPALGINWFEAIAYCRWLTERWGLPESDQCYEAAPLLENEDPTAGWVQLPAKTDWKLHLDRKGIRLLTEAEWEYVSRSGTATAYSFGNDVELLSKYEWHLENSNQAAHPVAMLRPNRRGLFDIHGNLREWCHDWYGAYSENAADPLGASRGTDRVSRGGYWDVPSRYCRSAYRNRNTATIRFFGLGFRVAMRL